MKKTVLFYFFLFALSFTVISQQINYQLVTDIPYYNEQVSNADSYVKERCKLDVYYPVDKQNVPTVIWFHGGGLTGGNKEIPDALKQQGMCVVGVNYRLAPKVNAPAYIEDAAAAIAWVFKNIDKYGGNPSLIFVSGHSAGGYLTCMVGLDKQWLAKHNIDANKIAGLIPLSAQTITHFSIRKERGIPDTQPIVDMYAPLYHVRADASSLLLITGDRELEMLGRYEENAYLARMMKIAGHKETKLLELQGYDHGMTFPAFPLLLQEVKRITNIRSKSL
ncbi:MAG: alpha/beta hydrolase fold domain-containing protein [Dysgonamonadaceae bacterium]|nr:alpha/beta hydrolase fold domain-containing protein [Dysgonamonadaceae bacterium]MDD3308438.1 alpha/beta hydrolase fold domain-containing protein [Dysgonamonadaceae bacterium]MDD3900119.1 alpha/beta hydrolase fold domain-containing protein [Dysgonamonadaceae bacterium]MDD4399278.1 alpha/beta hydrolase fold domain-containing protein [Dysgonamonadaceae bacterium]